MKRRINQGQAIRTIFGRARDPDRAAGCVALRQPVRVQQRLAGFAPCLEPALERLGLDARLPEPGGGALADIAAVAAIDDHALAGKAVRPARDGLEFHSPCGRQYALAQFAVIAGTNVDQHRRAGQTDDTG
jgi:hypothetical protein